MDLTFGIHEDFNGEPPSTKEQYCNPQKLCSIASRLMLVIDSHLHVDNLNKTYTIQPFNRLQQFVLILIAMGANSNGGMRTKADLTLMRDFINTTTNMRQKTTITGKLTALRLLDNHKNE
jgi:hypothetical protein